MNTNGTFRLRKNGDAWAQVAEPLTEGGAVPVAVENFDASRAQGVVSSLGRLRASDFAAPDVTRERAGLGESAARVVFVSGEGEQAQTTTLLVGNEATEGQRYVMREGDETIFIVSRFLAERRDWEADRRCERLLLTFNPGGYLRRRG